MRYLVGFLIAYGVVLFASSIFLRLVFYSPKEDVAPLAGLGLGALVAAGLIYVICGRP